MILINVDQKPGWRNFLSFVGPGFLVSLAYLDPGNMETDLQAGANHRFELLWVILIGLIFALVIQSLAANLGVSTGKHLSEVCKAEYPPFVKYCLWLLAEIAVRKLEILIAILVFVMAGCFFGEMSYVKPPAADVLKGMFVPKLSGQGATGDTIALFGALVMPHNLFLHSALVLSRKIPNSVRGINDSCRYFLIESGFALFVAFLINVSMIAVSGTVCSAKNLTTDEMDRCSDLTLYSASFLLKSSSTLYAIALLASGQSSTITGTYAGFLGSKDEEMAQELDNKMILSFEIPFALIPLLKFSSSASKMGPHKNSMIIIIFSWVLGVGLIVINIYYLITAFVHWLIHSSLPKVGNVLIGIIVFPVMAIYILSVIYLMFRKDVVVTFVEPSNIDPNCIMEGGNNSTDRRADSTNPRLRADLADVLLPE
ncbi:hypothetical protein OSB04_020879 [Centaurea solstitialis]|uniref:Uncharacterized protein n=1 Tax=Centaurea solstitialis TaxID=347529 RepID=A0AA38T4H4_9ASTR|nr:hypothetical protein OSB04_020879 [Centaurea solstitialis]